MQTFFQLPLELMQLSDDEFWSNINQLDELTDQIDVSAGGFAVTLSNGDKQVKIPFIRFKKTLPSDES